MTKQEKISAIKRLNERLTDMARTFGTDSPIYKEYLNSIKLAVGPENMHTSPRTDPKPGQKKLTAANMGVPVITRGPETYEALTDDKIEALLSHHTAGEVKREIREEAKRESEETGEDVTYEDVLETWSNVYDTINEYPDEFYDAVSLYWYYAGKGSPRPSYMTLDDIIQTQSAMDYESRFGSKETADLMQTQLIGRVNKAAASKVARLFT